MRNTTKLMISAACVFAAMPASAATFVFSSGNYIPGTTAPEPLLSPDILNMTTAGSKVFSGVTLTNQSGTINWSGGGIFLGSGAVINNQSLWNMTSDDQIASLGGVTSTFNNSGIFRKSGGIGASTFGTNAFVNSGTIDAQTGRIVLGGANVTINAGSIFTGAGQVDIGTSTFNGGFTSSNVDFTGGTFTGNAAALTGTADWEAGTFTGTWTVNSGAALNATTVGSKIISSATVTNNGTVNWSGGGIFLGSGAVINNQSLWNMTSDDQIANLGGVTSTFNNSGIFRKSAGAGVSNFGSNAFVNSGTIDAQTGRIVLGGGNATFNAGSIFTGAGEVDIGTSTFNGGFTSSNVDFTGGTFTGNAAALTGTADWEAGTFTGTWTVNGGATLNATTGGSKIISSATVTNNGSVNWSGGGIFLGNGSSLVTNGTLTATSDDQITNLGGAVSTITNNGLIQKAGGIGTTTLASGIGFDNNGTINVLSGTIGLPSAFTNDGTLGGTGTFTSANLTNGGIIAPGAPGSTGTLALTGNYAQTAFGTLNTQLASTGSFDLFNISGTAALNGTLALSCILSCAINTGDSFVILNSVGNLSGTFANVTTSGFLNGFAYTIVYDTTADLVRLNVTNAGNSLPAVPEPATWAMMLFGFGLIGTTLRRRSATRASATV